MKTINALIVLTMLFANSVFASESKSDCAVLTGATVAVDALWVDTSGYGNIEYFLKLYEVNNGVANRVADGLEKRVSRALHSNLAKTALSEIIADIRSTNEDAHGNIHYYINLVQTTGRLYKRAAEKIHTLASAACK